MRSGKWRQHTSNLQLAFHFILPKIIDGSAGVSAPIEQAWLADIQSQHTLIVLHQELGVFTDDHIVLHPNDLWLQNSVCWRRRHNWWDEERRWEKRRRERINRGRRREEGEVKLGQHFGLTKLCRFSRIKKRSVFTDISAPPLVLTSDIKIRYCCKGIKTVSDCSTLSVWHSELVRLLWTTQIMKSVAYTCRTANRANAYEDGWCYSVVVYSRLMQNEAETLFLYIPQVLCKMKSKCFRSHCFSNINYNACISKFKKT